MILLFHGTEILGFLAGLAVGFIGLVGAFIWLISRPPERPVVPAFVYLVVFFGIYGIFLVVDSLTIDSVPDASLFFLLVLNTLCFPWSLLWVLLANYGVNFDHYLLVGGFVNALLIYATSMLARRHEDKVFSSCQKL